MCYLCTALREKRFLKRKFWRGGRVVDCGGLENRCAARHPGFESLSLRQTLNTDGGKTKTSKRQENAPFGQSSVTKSLLKIRRNKIVTILVLSC